jgi:hypothetical protein
VLPEKLHVVACVLIHPGYLAAVAAAAEASHMVKLAGVGAGQTFTTGACAAVTKRWQMIGNKLVAPTAIPERAAIIEDSPLSGSGCRRRYSCR